MAASRFTEAMRRKQPRCSRPAITVPPRRAHRKLITIAALCRTVSEATIVAFVLIEGIPAARAGTVVSAAAAVGGAFGSSAIADRAVPVARRKVFIVDRVPVLSGPITVQGAAAVAAEASPASRFRCGTERDPVPCAVVAVFPALRRSHRRCQGCDGKN